MTIKEFSSYLDFAAHKANTTENDVEKLCKETIEYEFNSSFVNPCYVQLAKKILKDKAKVGTVVSFPLGQDTLNIKVESIKNALSIGADELDVVLNIGFIKEQKWQKCFEEMETLVKIVRDFDHNKIIKFIPETGYLTSDEIKKVAELMVKAKVDFFKTCSGFGPRGATLEDVSLIRNAIGDTIKIKVAGGISTYKQAVDFIKAGANRIGTSSAVKIIQEYRNL
jgi:deoxyribose-phosphate aldolase